MYLDRASNEYSKFYSNRDCIHLIYNIYILEWKLLPCCGVSIKIVKYIL